jgi:hypothetical protein
VVLVGHGIDCALRERSGSTLGDFGPRSKTATAAVLVPAAAGAVGLADVVGAPSAENDALLPTARLQAAAVVMLAAPAATSAERSTLR